jgi:serine protease AprX
VAGSFLDEAFPAARIGDDGFRGSGTSQSAAVASGAAALLVGTQPRLSPDQVKALLRSSARPLADTDPALQGAGVIDVAAAAASPAPKARQNFPAARVGGWIHGVLRNQYAVENPSSNRWSSNRWSSNRWSSNRWSSNRWSSNRWSSNRWSSNRWSSVEWGGGS